MIRRYERRKKTKVIRPLAVSIAWALTVVGLTVAVSMGLGDAEAVATQKFFDLEPGDLLVTDITDFRDPHKGGRLVKIDRETGAVTTLLETPKPPNGMALERVGDVLHVFLTLGGPVALGGQEHGNVLLLIVNLRERFYEVLDLPIRVLNPMDIEIDPTNGDLIVADAAEVGVFDREGTPGDIFRVKRELGEPKVAERQQWVIAPAEDPQDVAIDRDGNVLFSDTVGEVGSSFVRWIERGAVERGEAKILAEIPRRSNLAGVTFSPEGPEGGVFAVNTGQSCFGADPGGGQLLRFDVQEGEAEVLAKGLTAPRDIAFDPERPQSAFVTSFVGPVIRLDLESGEQIPFAKEGLNHPNYIEIVPGDAGRRAVATVADGTMGTDVSFLTAENTPVDTTAVAAVLDDEASTSGCAPGPPLSALPSALPTAWLVIVGAVLASLGAYLLWWR